MNKKYFRLVLLSLALCLSLFVLYKLETKPLKWSNKQYLGLSILENKITPFPPSATISGSTQVCRNSSPDPEITFTGSGGNPPYTFTYNINGGADITITSSGNAPVKVPVSTASIGTYVYQLVSVTNNISETTNLSGTATVIVSEPTVDFSFNNNDTCSDTVVNFISNVNGNGPFTYSWNFGDMTALSPNANPSHKFIALGCALSQTFNVTLTATDKYGCSKSITKQVQVKQKPNLQFYDIDARNNFTAQFDNCGNNTSDPSYTINVGNESSSSPCITSYDIDWGDGNTATGVTFPLSHTYSQLGSYNMVISGIGTNCNNKITYLVKNSSNPTGAIVNPGNTVNLCIPVAPLNFSIASWGTNPPDTQYFVNYGDGTSATYTQADLEASVYYNAGNPSNSQNFPIPHTYTESNCPNGSYTVILDITTSCGASNLTAGPIIILKKPEVSFDAPPKGCLNTPVQFVNTTQQGYNQNCNTNQGYFWDFGDGTTSTLRDPSHTYTTTGTFTVSLYAQNFCGTTTTLTKDICIEPQLTPSFTLSSNNGCSPLNVTTTNTTDLSNSCGGEIYLWEISYAPGLCGASPGNWTFTNGTDENDAAPTLNFVTAGTYTLSLTVTNACGMNTISQIIEVKQPPTTSINAINDFCGTASINPTANVQTCAPASETITYLWSFPGGTPNTANTLNPGTILYNTPGNYQISFSITTSCGTTTDTEDFVISPIPSITNTDLAQTICSGTASTEVILTSDITNTTYNWTAIAPAGVTGYLASGNTPSIPVQTIFNTNTTSQDVTYIITPSNNGCIGTPVNLVITVDPAPSFIDQPISETVCLNGPISTLSVSVNGSGTPTYQWYSNTVNDTTSGTMISGETNSTFTPPNNTVGVTYYYNIVSFTSGAGCNQITSNTARIEIVDGIQIVNNPLASQNICNGGIISTPLSVTHSGGTGIITYQWYINTTNSNTGGTMISGATNSTYLPPTFNTSGNFYYYVIISLSGSGCAPIISDVAEIIVADDPVIILQPIISQELCQGTIPINLEVMASGGIGNTYSYQWYRNTTNNTSGGTIISGATTSVFTPPTTSVGTLYYYAVITQNDPGCSVISNTSEVIINQAPTITNQPISETICSGSTFNTLSVSFSNGVGTPTYQWYTNTVNNNTTGTLIGGAITNTYTPPSATVGTLYYYAVITFSSGGCTEIRSQTSENTVNETPSISDKMLTICSGVNFNIIPDTSGGDNVPSGTLYTWTNPIIAPNGSITGASAETIPQNSISQTLLNNTTNPATATYSVTPISGICAGTNFTITITVNPSISITPTVTNSSCYSGNSGAIEISIAGGVPFPVGNPYLISWTGPSGYTSSNEDISNLAPGNYTVVINDDGGCPFSDTFTITEPTELVFSSVNFDPETISCFNANDGSISIDVLGGTMPYTYIWTKNGLPFSNAEDLNNLGPGDYNISVTDANNCPPISLSFQIVEPPLLQASLANQVDIICFGDATGEINVDVVGGRPLNTLAYSYNWTGPNGFTSNQQNLTGLVAGTYNLVVTDKSNCTSNLEVILLQSNEIIIDYTATSLECYSDNDASITINNITGGNPPYTIAWSNLGSGTVQNNLSPGTYIITVTDATNCQKEATIVIDAPPLFSINPTVTQISCFGKNDGRIVLNLQGGVSPVSLVWDDDPSAGVERNNIGPGSYSVTITDGKPCEIKRTFIIREPAALALSATTTDALDCNDANTGAINLIVTGGTLPLTYAWSNGATTEDLTNIPPGNYTITITDANGCNITGNWDVNRFEPLSIKVDTVTDADCVAKTVDQYFVAKVSGGVPPYQINWSSGTISGANNEIMETDQNGLFIISVIDDIGCSLNFSYNVQIPEIGDPNFSLTSYAYTNFGFYSIQDPIQFTNTSTGDFVGISWDFGDGVFSSEENPIHTYVTEGTYVVTQTVVYPFGCVYTKVITLVVEKGYSLIAPNAFTPNKDTLNDFFVPSFIALSNLKLEIFDTWGSLIYSEAGNNIKGWNGQLKSSEAENGNYYYTFSGQTLYGQTITSKGAFVLIK